MAKKRLTFRTSKSRRSWGIVRLLKNLLAVLIAAAIAVPPAWVILYRFVPPPITILMNSSASARFAAATISASLASGRP